MKENPFLNWIIDVGNRTGWRSYHIPMPVRPIPGGGFVAETRGKGVCDLIMFHPSPRLIFAEVKGSTGGKLKPEQVEFLRQAREVAQATVMRPAITEATQPLVFPPTPIGVYSWRPGQETIIEAILKGKVMM